MTDDTDNASSFSEPETPASDTLVVAAHATPPPVSLEAHGTSVSPPPEPPADPARALAENAVAQVNSLQRDLRRITETVTALESIVGSAVDRADVDQLRDKIASSFAELRADLQAHYAQTTSKRQAAQQALDDYLMLAASLPLGGVPALLKDREVLTDSLERERKRVAKLEEDLRAEYERRARSERELLELRAVGGTDLVSQLSRREAELAERAKRVSAAEALELENAELLRQIATLQAAVESRTEGLRNARQIEEQAATIRERDEQLQSVQSQLNRARAEADHHRQSARSRHARIDELEEQHSALQAQFEQYRLEVEHERSRARERDDELGRLRSEWWDLSDRRERMQREYREAVDARHTAEAERDRYREEAANAASAVRAAVVREERERFESLLATIDAERETTERHLRAHLEARGRELDELHDRRADIEREIMEHRSRTLEELWAEEGKLEREVATRSGQLATLQDDIAQREKRAGDLQCSLVDLQSRVGPLKDEIGRLQDERRRLAHIDLEMDERLSKLKDPFFASTTKRTAQEQEASWLEEIRSGIKEAGFVFPDRLLYAFHTSLKTARFSPITVLSGISGTGKSELPRLYADLGGVNFLNLAVQPSWDSPDDLFGFFNYTEGRYRATPLSRVLYQVSGHDSQAPLRDQLVLVLLDEMNIARVEYYFAELLSKLETRRNLERSSRDAGRASIAIDTGTTTQDLFIDHNVLFVGTTNEDESTLALSDKVKDRAHVITFPSPRDFHGRTIKQVTPRQERISRESWEAWQALLRQVSSEDRAHLQERCREFNEALQEVGRAIGHRVFQAVVHYVAAYPRIDDEARARADALSDVFAQKLLPKLVGVETATERGSACLDRVAARLPDDLKQAFERGRNNEYFVWEGSRAIYEVPG